MLPKIGAKVELLNGLWVTVQAHNPNGYEPDKPQEFVGKYANGETGILHCRDMHPRYFR